MILSSRAHADTIAGSRCRRKMPFGTRQRGSVPDAG